MTVMGLTMGLSSHPVAALRMTVKSYLLGVVMSQHLVILMNVLCPQMLHILLLLCWRGGGGGGVTSRVIEASSSSMCSSLLHMSKTNAELFDLVPVM